jgi:hybrid cluster-associated redox disulfide protein
MPPGLTSEVRAIRIRFLVFPFPAWNNNRRIPVIIPRNGEDVKTREVPEMADTQTKHFRPDMTVADAMAQHPGAPEVFAAFHLGGCAHCGINKAETVEQVCAAYGIGHNVLLEVLEGLFEEQEADPEQK